MKIPVELKYAGRQQVFTHLDTDGTYRHFPIDTMTSVAKEYANKCAEIILMDVPVVKDNAEFIAANMGIERERIDRLKFPYLTMPLIAIMWPGFIETVTIVDGNHRYLRLYELGFKSAQCYVFKPEAWEQLLLKLENDEAILSKPSGIIEHEARDL